MATGATAPRSGRPKGPRPRHVPQRMCVACREHAAKRALTRLVRTPEGTVEIDPTGKRNGRGAYLCDRRACWERAIKTGALARALNTSLTPDTIEALRAHAGTRPEPAAQGGAAPAEGTND